MKSKLTWLLAILLFSCLIGNAQLRKNQTNNLPVLFSSVSVIQRNQRINIFYKGSDSGLWTSSLAEGKNWSSPFRIGSMTEGEIHVKWKKK